MAIAQGEQVIKSRDDVVPVLLRRDRESDDGEHFTLGRDATCSWARDGEVFGPEKLRPRIEPWLTALVQSEHLSLLVGSGLTNAVHGLASNAELTGMSPTRFNVFDAEISAEAERTAQLAGRDSGNFEDQIRAANELLHGLRVLASTKDETSAEHAHLTDLRAELENVIASFAASIVSAERNLLTALPKRRELALNYLVSFLMSFASRTGTRDRLHLFTTNYDRFIEVGADIAGLRLIDRFVGTLSPVFRASRLDVDLHYNPPGIRGEPRYLEGVARFTKLHGSVDWVDCDDSIRRVGLPFGANEAAPYLLSEGDGSPTRVMMYPNPAKDRETTSHPYVELFRDFAGAVCRPNSTVVCYGYGFGDEHINRVFRDMLTIPSTHLVVISRDDPLGRIMSNYDVLGRHAQVTLLIGDHFGDLETVVGNYLPKPAIDRATFRMAELMKARWSASDGQVTGGAGDRDSEEAQT